MLKKTQDDHVKEDLGYQPKEVTRNVTIPGLDTLHQKPIPEIAEVLANVLRSERNIIKMIFTVGKGIELTTGVD